MLRLSWKNTDCEYFFINTYQQNEKKQKTKNVVLILSTNTYTPVTSRQRARSGDDFSTI